MRAFEFRRATPDRDTHGTWTPTCALCMDRGLPVTITVQVPLSITTSSPSSPSLLDQSARGARDRSAARPRRLTRTLQTVNPPPVIDGIVSHALPALAAGLRADKIQHTLLLRDHRRTPSLCRCLRGRSVPVQERGPFDAFVISCLQGGAVCVESGG